MSEFVREQAERLASQVLFDYVPRADKVAAYLELVEIIAAGIEGATEVKQAQAEKFKQAFDELIEVMQADTCEYCRQLRR